MAKGTDIEVVIWIAAVIIWTVFKILGKAVGKNKKPSTATTRQPKKSPASIQEMISQFEPFLTQTPPSTRPVAEQEPPPEPAPAPVPPPKPAVVRKMNKEDVWKDEAHAPAVSQLVFSSSGNSLRLPLAHFPTASFSDKKHTVNKLRPDWKNGEQVRQAMLASIILGRPVGDPGNAPLSGTSQH